MYTRTLLPGFAGVATFLRAPESDVETVEHGAITVLGIPWDDPRSQRTGAGAGPRGLRESSAAFFAEVQADPRHELVEIETGRRLRFHDRPPIVDLGDLVLWADEPRAASAALRGAAALLVSRGALPVFLGGGRAISAPLVLGCAAALSGKRLGYIQLTRSLALAAGENPTETATAVSAILEAGAVRQEDVAWLGLHGYVPLGEWERARAGGGVIQTADDLANGGSSETVRQAVEPIVARCDAIYLTLDVQAVDTAYAAGTPDLEVGGLEPSRALALAGALADLPLIALDVVNVAPDLDPSGRAERLGFELILQVLGTRLAQPQGVGVE